MLSLHLTSFCKGFQVYGIRTMKTIVGVSCRTDISENICIGASKKDKKKVQSYG